MQRSTVLDTVLPDALNVLPIVRHRFAKETRLVKVFTLQIGETVLVGVDLVSIATKARAPIFDPQC